MRMIRSNSDNYKSRKKTVRRVCGRVKFSSPASGGFASLQQKIYELLSVSRWWCKKSVREARRKKHSSSSFLFPTQDEKHPPPSFIIIQPAPSTSVCVRSCVYIPYTSFYSKINDMIVHNTVLPYTFYSFHIFIRQTSCSRSKNLN